MSVTAHIDTLKEIVAHPLNHHRKLAALADYFRWNIGKRLLGADYILPLADEVKIILSDRQNYATLAYTCRLWDFEEMMFMLHFLRPGDRFADIGANVGAYTVLASAVAGAHSVAFEPVPFTHDELVRNIRLNNIEHLADAHRICLGSEKGTVRMTADRGGLNHVATEGDTGTFVDTEVMCLDEVLAGTSCQFIKMDAEGYEAEILKGARATMENSALSGLIVELNDSGLRYGHTNEAVHDTLTGFGFAPYRYDPRQRTLAPERGFNASALNTLYLRNLADITSRVASARSIVVRDEAI